MKKINYINLRNLNSDTTDVALYLLAEELKDLEREMELADDSEFLALATKHRGLLDFYNQEILKYEALNPYQTEPDS